MMPPPPATDAGRSAATFAAVAAGAIGRDRIDRATGTAAGFGKDRLDVGAVGALQRLCRHQRVVFVLVAGKRLAIDDAAPAHRRGGFRWRC